MTNLPSMDQWHLGPMAAFDLETTGVDVESDRVVTAALLRVDSEGRPTLERTWLVNPGVPIPEDAARIHGVTTQRAEAEGVPAIDGVEQITSAVADILADRVPLVVMNAPYDLTLLDREARRHGLTPLAERLDGSIEPILDPLILDKHIDRFRRGKRNLTALCDHYDIEHGGAHHAGADAAAAVAVVRRIASASTALATMGLGELHSIQVRAAATQAASLQAYLRRRNPSASVDPNWPIIPAASNN
ncbi:exonuclease domain-containing protein [Spiractinospora alimapuensis]|uniref:exonuclease domain-containing protein n=1 Tax=Spiractinospora alimapuensis TaxID=2820884 RepID=UPI001F198E35|nr:exonuclease domain-containing protein [Spiractinospora alimapuensis]